MPFQPILPTWLALNGCNDTTASGMSNLRTGAPVNAGGLNLGDFFDLTEQEANSLSNTATGTLHAGRYRRVQVDSSATAGNVKTGTIGLMLSGGQPQLNLVTSWDKGIAGCHQVVFLNTVTPGNFCFVQELGVLNCLCGTSITKAAPATGDIINATTAGVVDDPTSQTATVNTLGIALDPPNPNTIIRVLATTLPSLQG
jgi:hypothetical protein